jgi:hypothetical protein
VKQAFNYLRSVNSSERSHLVVAHHCASRNAFLVLATFRTGPHPDQNVKETGLAIVLHILSCTRSAPSHVIGIPVAFFSKHAMSRLHQRGYDIENTDATSIFSFAGVLGLLTNRSAHGDLSLLYSDTLLVGSQHRCPATDARGRPIEDIFFDVRSVLAVDEIGDSRWTLLEQGRTAASVVVAWFTKNDPQEELEARIPFLPRREDCYPMRVTRANCEGANAGVLTGENE